MRAIRKEDSSGSLIKKYDISSLNSVFMAGERADPAIVEWCQQNIKKHVVDAWWQTETGFPMGTYPLGYATQSPVFKPGSCSFPVPGYDIRIVDDHNKLVAPGETGNIVVKEPLPPGTFLSLWTISLFPFFFFGPKPFSLFKLKNLRLALFFISRIYFNFK